MRSVSCRATSASTVAWSALGVERPPVVDPDRLHDVVERLAGSFWISTAMPTWACVAGYASTSPAGRAVRSAAPISAYGSTGRKAPSLGVAASARAVTRRRIVRCAKMSRTVTSWPAARSDPTRVTAVIESPPRSKKLSVTLTRSRSSTHDQTPAIADSTGPLGRS